jgi:hypothetical protein
MTILNAVQRNSLARNSQGFSPEYSGFLLVCSSDARLKGNHIILKFIIMKTYLVKSTKRELNETTPVWDAFKDHLENIYFPGALELLAKDLIAFEYEAYKNERV